MKTKQKCIRPTRDIDLTVISIEMDRQPISRDDRWKVSSVDEEKNRAKNRPVR
jgi:hypothetical protein